MENEQSHQANETLKTKIQYDDIVNKICEIFTLQTPEYHTFEKHNKPHVKNFKIGVIVGSSGSGKSLLLKEFGTEEIPKWDNNAICSSFIDYEDAEERLLGAGLSSIPIWLAPYNILSNGQKYRADVARKLKDSAIFDEFTSIIDRNTAHSLSNSLKNYIERKNIKNIVISTPHHDIIDHLEPDWVYDTDSRTLTIKSEHKEIIEEQIENGKEVLEFYN